MSNSNNLSLISVNVRGMHKKSKRSTIFEYLNEKHIDIACLQETFCTRKSVKDYNKSWSGDVYHCLSDSDHSRGVAIYTRKDLEYKFLDSHKGENGRKLMINIEIQEQIYTIVNIYAPNNVKCRGDFFVNLMTWIKRYSLNDNNVILTGDFNCDLSASDTSVNYLSKLMKYLNMKDTWKGYKPSKPGYTYIKPGNVNCRSRIDYVLLTGYTFENVKNISTRYIPKVPDHKGIIVNFKANVNLGPGYWKLNTSMLNNSDYRKGIYKILAQTISEYTGIVDHRTLWDFIKIRFKEFSIQYCCLQSKANKNELNNLEKQLDNLESKINLSVNQIDKVNIETEKNELRNKIDVIYLEKAKGAQVRSKVKWLEDGERNTKYFLSLEKKHQTNNIINKIKVDNKTYTETHEILAEASGFYENLYQKENSTDKDIDEYINSINTLNTLNGEEQELCEGMITETECEKAIKIMKAGSSPGSDGLPTEFYRTFWHVIKIPLLNAYNESFEKTTLSLSQKTSILTLIFKKGDRELLKNYRPISLSNADYKIIAFVLQKRLHEVIPKLVKNDQTAYIKNRFIGQNVRLLIDVIEYAKTNNEDGILLFADYLKAYDTVSWNFMFKCLEKYGFGPQFINWIKVLYSKPIAKVKINGWISEGISLGRGIRQGCPISALLFILVSEFMAESIRTNQEINGIILKNKETIDEVKVLQYADDTIFFLKSTDDVKMCIKEIERFSQVAGPKLNISKTECLGIGNLEGLETTIANIKTTNKPIRYLGIYITHNKAEFKTLNWENQLVKLQKLLDSWRTRHLTLFGKIAIIKSLALPKIIYPATMLSIPEGISKDINKIIFNFIWNHRDRIKRNTLIGNVNQGGLGMIDIESQFEAIKAAWVQRIISDNGHWSFLPKYYLNKLGENFEFLTMSFNRYKMFPYMKTIPLFYQEVIISFTKSKTNDTLDNLNDLLQQHIWGNRILLVNGKALFSSIWIQSELKTLKDVLYPNGKCKTGEIISKLVKQTDYFTQITLIKKAIRPFTYLFCTNNDQEMITPNTEIPDIIYERKSKYFYQSLITQKYEIPYQQKAWENYFSERMFNWEDIYTKKVKKFPDRKIAEFNYKIIMKILICNLTLYNWNKIESPICHHCKEIQTVQHMLYECYEIKYMWKCISELLNYNINFLTIVLGVNEMHHIISTIAFIVYKRWVIERNDDLVINLETFIQTELRNRKKVIEISKFSKIYSLRF